MLRAAVFFNLSWRRIKKESTYFLPQKFRKLEKFFLAHPVHLEGD